MARPNFIIFLTDDQGYGDLSCMGATDFRTPNLDALAASGVLFTDWYSNSPVCSPSRASLLTGRYPGNAGVRSILAGHRTATGLPPSVPTLATALKKLRYQTAMFGKWHLGLARGSRPEDHGFDEWFGFMAGCIDYFSHIFYWGMAGGMDPIHDLWENGKEIYANGQYFTEMITERSLSWIRKAARNGRPFFLYVPYSAPHYPMHAPQKYIDRFPDLSWERQIMAAMLSAVDDSVGAIMNWPEKIPPGRSSVRWQLLWTSSPPSSKPQAATPPSTRSMGSILCPWWSRELQRLTRRSSGSRVGRRRCEGVNGSSCSTASSSKALRPRMKSISPTSKSRYGRAGQPQGRISGACRGT